MRLAAVGAKTVKDIMHRGCVAFDVDDTDFVVAAEMIRRHIKVAPVLKDGVMEGYISRAYLIKRMMRAAKPGSDAEVLDDQH